MKVLKFVLLVVFVLSAISVSAQSIPGVNCGKDLLSGDQRPMTTVFRSSRQFDTNPVPLAIKNQPNIISVYGILSTVQITVENAMNKDQSVSFVLYFLGNSYFMEMRPCIHQIIARGAVVAAGMGITPEAITLEKWVMKEAFRKLYDPVGNVYGAVWEESRGGYEFTRK